MHRFPLLLLLCSTATALDPTPVVIWHGVGDTCCQSGSMDGMLQHVRDAIPGVYIYSVGLNPDPETDKHMSYLSNMNKQVARVYEPSLSSQPRMRTLLTLGGQHQGVYGFPGCYGDTTVCDDLRFVFDGMAYVPYLQNTPESSKELNLSYKTNLLALALVMFDEDVTVISRESSWFGFYKEKDIDVIIPYNESRLYTDDRIGLRTLDETGRLHFYTMHGRHMAYDWNILKQLIHTYFK